jgi:hypothetical protein
MKAKTIFPLSNTTPGVMTPGEVKALRIQLQAEERSYRETLGKDKLFEVVKPIRLRIKFIKERIKKIQLNHIN